MKRNWERENELQKYRRGGIQKPPVKFHNMVYQLKSTCEISHQTENTFSAPNQSNIDAEDEWPPEKVSYSIFLL